jgi:hypothetical protein
MSSISPWESSPSSRLRSSSSPSLSPLLTYKIDNTHPVELIDLTEALLSLGDEYARFVESLPAIEKPKEYKLVIKEIRSGSIETQLMELAPPTAPFMSDSTVVLEFGKYLMTAVNYFLGRSNSKPSMDRRSYDNIAKIVNPVAKDNGSQMHIQNHFQGNVEMTVNVNSVDANAIQNAINREKLLLKEPEHKFYERVVLAWYQAGDTIDSPIGDKAVIDDISSKPLKVIFQTDEMKGEIIHGTTDPFRQLYIVDVLVEMVQGSPVAYKILKLHETFENPV